MSTSKRLMPSPSRKPFIMDATKQVLLGFGQIELKTLLEHIVVVNDDKVEFSAKQLSILRLKSNSKRLMPSPRRQASPGQVASPISWMQPSRYFLGLVRLNSKPYWNTS
jgi:hypothetical protein